MNYQHEVIISHIRMLEDEEGTRILPIKGRLDDDGYYYLRSASGENRMIPSGNANTIWANCGWPERGQWAALWTSATYRER